MTPMNFDGEIALGKMLNLRSRACVKNLKPEGGLVFFSKQKKFVYFFSKTILIVFKVK